MRTLTHLRHQCVLGMKRVFYRGVGEPYKLNGMTLRYVPGSRPVRMRYAMSRDDVVARYDALQAPWIADHIAAGDTAIDIGAYHGTYSIIMAAKSGRSGCVVAFEPDPYAREVMRKNFALNKSLKSPVIENAACSNRMGQATLFTVGGNARSTLAWGEVESTDPHKPEELTVPLVTLDAYLAEHALVPRCVKIDAEGAEIRILQGATCLLSSKADIVCELHPFAWPRFGNTLAELKDVLAASGRQMRYLDQATEMAGEAEYGTVALERS